MFKYEVWVNGQYRALGLANSLQDAWRQGINSVGTTTAHVQIKVYDGLAIIVLGY
jgi:hypothetical protein